MVSAEAETGMEIPQMRWPDKIDTTRQELRALNALIPDTARAFGGLGKAVKEGVDKAEAEDIKGKLEAAGAEVELK